MEHILMIAVGDFRARLLRYLLTGVAIGVGVALLVALYAVSDATRSYVEDMLYKVYPADLLMYSESINIPQGVLDAIRRVPYVESANGIILTSGVYGGKVVSIVGIPLRHVDYFAIDLKEGRLPEAGGEAVVEESLGVRPGDTITIKIYSGALGGERALQVKVVGVMRSFMRGFVGAFRLNLVVVSLSWLQENIGAGPFVNAVLITVKDKTQVKPLEAALKGTFRDAQVYTQESLLETVTQVFNALNVVFSAIGGAGLAAAAVTTFAVMSITVRERLREFGLLKAIGLSSRDITISVMVEVLTIAVAAGVGGVAAGYFGANAVKQVLLNMGINFNVEIVFKPYYLLLGLGTSAAVALVGAVSPMYRVAKLRPLEIMQLWR
ncbi:ABC transporter permease [Pyrobaculum ferrireducens]|uniref:ABC transporter n=1 Tax=Pyrobaculum ferrireducens TaxID=1104324 RepID=G7VHA0_9CREN|nr:ABC transporter permease [Pyrobaculum ferrireducens]AET32003.1 ABC transporter [Pyrobaculum ferrireducens]